MLGTPGTLRKPVLRDLYLTMSSDSKPPHRGEGHCLLFLINACAAARATGSCDEQRPPCAEHPCPKELIIAYVWDGRCPPGSLGDQRGDGAAVLPRVMHTSPVPSQPRVIQCSLCKGQRESLLEAFLKMQLYPHYQGFSFFLLPSLFQCKEQPRRKQEIICLKIWQTSDSSWCPQLKGSRRIKLPRDEWWGNKM